MTGPFMHTFGGVGVILVPVLVVAFYALVVTAIVKVFQISRDVKAIKRRLAGGPPA